MCRRHRLCLFLLFASLPATAGKKSEDWVQVTSPHFVVVTNANEKQGRRVADQFERMRSLFHSLFPKAQLDNGSPIIVLAVKDEKDFRALEPASYLAKGALKLAGLFLRGPDKNYVLMRLDADGEHPYSVIYHEYTHFLLSRIEFMPLWLNEGLAEFYQNTDIHEKEALLGQASADNILWLRQNRILPVTTLLAVDHKSPYYHEENKGSIFYAESWALTRYLQFEDFSQKTHRVADYLSLVSQKVDPVAAALQAFGDLKKLQTDLDNYVSINDFKYFKVTTTTEVDDSAFKVQPLTEPQSDAVRADFLAYNDRTTDAQALLDRVLQQDPQNVSAHETKGYLEFRAGLLDEARKWYAQAVQLDSQSFLAHYYFAAMSINAPDPPPDEQVESSLRAAIKLNPSFAPAFDLLATFLGMRSKNLDEAHMLGLTAVYLDPSDIPYRINVANILLHMAKSDSAIQVLKAAEKIAKNPAEAQSVQSFLEHAQQYVEYQQQRKEQAEEDAELADTGETSETNSGSAPAHAITFVEKGPHRFLTGMLKNVHCSSQKMDLTVTSKVMNVDLHSENYYQVQYSTLNFAPTGSLNPCKDLEGRAAKVEYVDSADKSVVSRVLSIELHK